MKKKACAVMLAVILTLIWPAGGISQEDPGNFQRAQRSNKSLQQQKNRQLLAQMKVELQQLKDLGYTPEQLEQCQREQHAKIIGELKRSALEKPR